MERRYFGATGMSVSTQCLGAMMFGAAGNTDDDECIAMVHRALDAGINFIDTADGYSGGHSEEVVGKALQGERDNIVVATKVYFPMGKDPNQMGGSRRWIIKEVENSLRRLGTEWIDIYQLHRRDPNVDLEESLSAMDQLVRDGKVRYVGMSASAGASIAEARHITDARNLTHVRSEQSLYNIFNRSVEREVLPTCERYGIGTLTYGPLNGGWLAGKYRRDQAIPEDSRAARTGGNPRSGARWNMERAEAQRKFEALDQLDELSNQAGIPLTHLAMGFVTEHPAVTSAIIGPRTPAQLEDAIAAADVRLSADVLNRIDEIVPVAQDLDPLDTTRVEPHLSKSKRRRGQQ